MAIKKILTFKKKPKLGFNYTKSNNNEIRKNSLILSCSRRLSRCRCWKNEIKKKYFSSRTTYTENFLFCILK